MTIASSISIRSVGDLAKMNTALRKHERFNKLFEVCIKDAACKATPELKAKYGVPIDNVQQIVSIRNIVTNDLTEWNPLRRTKPQNFKADADAPIDPLALNGTPCDFCNWAQFTAEDTFGRIESEHAVSASNLFKYVAPYQGVILFKHHDPFEFNLEQLSDLLTVANTWFTTCRNVEMNTNSTASALQLHPLLVWNVLQRAGASFYHGHVQTMSSHVPFPDVHRAHVAAKEYKARGGGSEVGGGDYYEDVVGAHACVGLSRRLSVAMPSGDLRYSWLDDEDEDEHDKDTRQVVATAHASLCPTKDAEIVILGKSLDCPAFQALFYSSVRALIDELGVQSFNAGIYPRYACGGGGEGDKENQQEVVGRGIGSPIIGKIVSRGRISSASSDFGGLEVFGGATIGHTDPGEVIDAVDAVATSLLL